MQARALKIVKLVAVVVGPIVVSLLVGWAALAQGPGTAFSYQGSLSSGDGPVEDFCTFGFDLYDAATDGAQIGATQTVTDVTVSEGLFTVELDFGTEVFTGPLRYLEIEVQCSGAGSPTTLSPRQPLYPTPYAMYATQAGRVDWGNVISRPPGLAVITETISGLSCSDGQVVKWNAATGRWACAADGGGTSYAAGAGITITNGIISSTLTAGAGLTLSNGTLVITPTYRLPQSCAANEIPKWDGTAWLCATDVNTDTTYAAGAGITIADNIISNTLTAGTDIIIANDTISSTVPHPANVVWVAKSGGDFSSIQAALNSITDAAPDNPYLVLVAPGHYTERVIMKPYVDIQGAGEGKTIISWVGGGNPTTGFTVKGADDAELRFVTVENDGSSWNLGIGIYNSGAAPSLLHVTVTVSDASDFNYGVVNDASSPEMDNVTVTVSGASGGNLGVYNFDSSSPTVRNSVLSGSSGFCYNDYSSSMMVATSMLSGPVAGGGYTCVGAYDGSFTALDASCQ